jgi:hypothetical protein
LSVALCFGSAFAAGCAGDKASSGGGTTPASGGEKSGGSSGGGAMEQDAVVKVKENFFPPVNVGAWTCEPKSFDESRVARLHCTAPAGSTGLLAELKNMEEVESVEPAK